MAKLWNDSFLVGVKEIDDQHKELVKRVEAFHDACNQKKANSEIKEIIDYLKKYVVFHFQAEERIQQNANYPDMPAHKEKHRQFLQSVDDFNKKLEQEGFSLTLFMKFNRELTDWLINHIKKEDKKLGSFIKN